MKVSGLSDGANRAKIAIMLGPSHVNTTQADTKKTVFPFLVGDVKITFREQSRKDSSGYTFYELSLNLTTNIGNESEIYVCILNSFFLYKEKSDCSIKLVCDDTDWRRLYETKIDVNIELTVEIKVITVAQKEFSVLHEDTELTDFELRGEDGSVKVHRAVLAASSPVLRAMLGKECKETKEKNYHIKDATQTTLQHLKDYMYTNAIPETDVEELLLLAHCYMMPELENKCTRQLLDTLSAVNVMEMTKFAFGHGLNRFCLAILSRIESGKVRIKEVQL